jgi:S1-C subfamily serine protease
MYRIPETGISQARTGKGPRFGAVIGDASKNLQPGTPALLAAYIDKTRPGSVAERIGLAPGDIVIQLNMKRITNAADLEQTLSNLSENDSLSLVFIRNNIVQAAEGTF